MDQTGAGTERPDTSVRKARRRAGRSRGNGRYGASPWPRLRDILFKDLRPTDLPRNFRQDLKRLYRFYLDEERRAEERVQKLTDDHVHKIDELLKRKEAEILEV